MRVFRKEDSQSRPLNALHSRTMCASSETKEDHIYEHPADPRGWTRTNPPNFSITPSLYPKHQIITNKHITYRRPRMQLQYFVPDPMTEFLSVFSVVDREVQLSVSIMFKSRYLRQLWVAGYMSTEERGCGSLMSESMRSHPECRGDLGCLIDCVLRAFRNKSI